MGTELNTSQLIQTIEHAFRYAIEYYARTLENLDSPELIRAHHNPDFFRPFTTITISLTKLLERDLNRSETSTLLNKFSALTQEIEALHLKDLEQTKDACINFDEKASEMVNACFDLEQNIQQAIHTLSEKIADSSL